MLCSKMLYRSILSSFYFEIIAEKKISLNDTCMCVFVVGCDTGQRENLNLMGELARAQAWCVPCRGNANHCSVLKTLIFKTLLGCFRCKQKFKNTLLKGLQIVAYFKGPVWWTIGTQLSCTQVYLYI